MAYPFVKGIKGSKTIGERAAIVPLTFNHQRRAARIMRLRPMADKEVIGGRARLEQRITQILRGEA